jgi:ATP-binding cassette subfamily C protein
VSAPVTILVLGLGGLLTLALARRRRRANATGHALTEADRQMHRAIDAALAGMKLTRTHGVESRQIAELEAVARPLKRVHLALAGNPAAVRMWFDAGAALILSIAAYVGLRGVALTPTELVVLLVVFVRLAPHLSTVQVYYQTLSAELPAFAAVAALDRELAASAETGSDDATGDTEWQSGALRLDDVSFTYDRDPVLAGVSLDVPRGHTVAIVGASGAGKTTIADLVLGLLSPSDGRVLVDGRPLTDERRAGWQRQVGYVPQDAFLFHDTIRRNLLWAAPGADDAALRDALQAAAADFVWALPDRVDTVVGDRGVLLSTGERQRLALARALLRRPRLLVLDEATSALDSENERAIQRAVRGLHGQVTILVIAHRLSTVRDVDQLYVLDAGRVAESGTWAELMARPAGRLRALARAQAMTPDDDTIGATPQRSEQHG